jgi:hypothetical protein
MSPARFAPAAPSATTISTATTTTTTATEITTAAHWLGPRFVDDQCAAVELVLVKFVDGFLCILVRRHFDERKSARAARCLIAHHPDIVYGTSAAE